MDFKKFFVAGIADSIVIFLLSGLWHQLILTDFYTARTQALARTEVDMLWITIGIFVLGFLMAYVYPMGYQGGSSLKEGFRFGAVIGLIWILPWSLIIHGIWNYPLDSVILDAVWHMAEEGVAGIVIALVYGSNSEATESEG